MTAMDLSVFQIKTKIASCHTADSKPVKQEVNGTVILPPLVFPGLKYEKMSKIIRISKMAIRFEQLKSDLNIIITCICLKTNNGNIFYPNLFISVWETLCIVIVL